jgi:hypothetical protein
VSSAGILALEGFVLLFLLFFYFLSYLVKVKHLPQLGSVFDDVPRNGVSLVVLTQEITEGCEESGVIDSHQL